MLWVIQIDAKLKSLIIIGAGAHAHSVANVALAQGYHLEGFVDNATIGRRIFDAPVLSSDKVMQAPASSDFAIAIGDNVTRKRVALQWKNKLPDAHFPAIVHPSAILGINCAIGAGTVVMANAHIGPNSTLGEFCILNTGASLDHDCNVGAYSALAPGVITGGGVQLGSCSAISIGASVKNGVKIGANTVIGGASYVNRDIPDNVVAYGIPCKVVRSRADDDLT